MESIETFDVDGYRVQIVYDNDADDPRSWDNLGKMVCFHKKYKLGDKHHFDADDYDGWEDMKEHIINLEDACVILPLYLYDHSGITISTTPFNDRWDSGQVGWIYATRKDVIDWKLATKNITASVKDTVNKILESEVKTYDKYITGEVYKYFVYKIETCSLGDEHLSFVDSCGGYYDIEDCKIEATDYINSVKFESA